MRLFLSLMVALVAAPAFAISPFQLPVFNGETDAVFDTADYPDSVIVLEVFMNSCGPCNRNAPNVDALAADFADEKVQVVDVGAGQTPRELASWIARHNPNHTVAQGRRSLMQEIGLTATPTTVVLDCNLDIVYRSVGLWSNQGKAAIRQKIADTLATQQCQ